MSKTVAALLAGRAIADGHVAGVDARIGDYLEEWAADPRGDITVEQLLTMSGGLEQIGGDYGYAVVPENPAVAQHFGSDFVGPCSRSARPMPAGGEVGL